MKKFEITYQSTPTKTRKAHLFSQDLESVEKHFHEIMIGRRKILKIKLMK